MNIRDVTPRNRNSKQTLKKPHKEHKGGLVLIGLILLALVLSWTFLGTSHASTESGQIKSGWNGYCLDDYKSKLISGNQVDLWGCNGSSAQDWKVSLTQISREGNLCLTANSKTKITVKTCNQDPTQVWIKDSTSFINPSSGLCLSAPKGGEDQSLSLDTCNNLTSSAKSWSPYIDLLNYQCSGTQGQVVACNAVKEWIKWSNEPNNHLSLLNTYTGGASYEEWCADFVSYVYKESGYPFSNGNYGGWDENNAPDIISQGFTADNNQGYLPKVGDVAFFDYNGGHVEIVVVGGKNPTFVYGNSAVNDPTTGNGDMAVNNITSKANEGSLQYYMTPNSHT